MRYFLLWLHAGLAGAFITVIAAVGTAAHTNPVEVGGLSLAYIAAALLHFFLTGVSVGSQLAPFITFLQVIFIIYAISAVSAVLAGYRPLRWTKWIGFVLNAVLGLLALMGLSEGFSFAFISLAGVFFLYAFLFLRLRRNADAERIRRPAAWLNIALWFTGVLIYAAVSPEIGLWRVLFALFSVIPFVLHYLAVTLFSFRVKEALLLILTLAFTLICALVIVFAIPVLFGPLLVSWFSVALFVEAMFLSAKKAPARAEPDTVPA